MRRLLHILAISSLASCTHRVQEALFTPLPSSRTNIHFSNDIKEDDSTSSFIDEFGYMGGGVGIGDFNNDGLKDIFFTGNQVSCRLYLNKGGNKFEDVTEKAGLHTRIWATGVSIVDINQDGYDDIYVCTFGKNLLQRSANLLFINQRDGTFHEAAAEYGLADTGYSTQAVFVDYDHDGDLDMYLVNYWLNGPNANTIFPKDLSGHSPANDRLYRNDGDAHGPGHPVFTDVTTRAGIHDAGYGLGIVASDLNGDGWPDIYVTDDFVSDDLLWLNDHNGHFTDRLATATRHTSYSAMGVDAADIDNDGRPDIMALDMLPEDNRRKKLTFSFMNYERYQLERSFHYQPQFMRNTLQLNNGAYRAGDTSVPFFSEIGQLAGISATDWSWSVLLADFDLDGWKDIHITNGIGRDFINSDFLDFSNTVFTASYSKEQQHHLIRDKLGSLHHINLRNYLYRNHHDYRFTDLSDSAGIGPPSMSGGAAYADLDNDGDPDLVVNNIDREAFILINNTIQPGHPPTAHYLRVRLQGDTGNKGGFGARLHLYAGGQHQLLEESPVRGYFSSVDRDLIFGLGKSTVVDSIVVQWPDGRGQTLHRIPADALLTVYQKNAHVPTPPLSHPGPPLFTSAIAATGIYYRHKENVYNDFATRILLPQKYSQLGPGMATGDVNGDGLTDLFIGGGFNAPGSFFLQQRDGRFLQKELVTPSTTEAVTSTLFDADGDGDLDLLITGGDPLFGEDSPNYIPRLFFNDGRGNFSPAPAAIPSSVTTLAGCVAIGDINGDGQPDLFIGGRVSCRFPLPPRSFLLLNDHGVFRDATGSICPSLVRPGMVTAAQWMDLDKDGQPDLVLAGEWMPLRFFKNNHGRLTEVTASTGLPDTHGMWRSLALVDIDGDGDLDIVAGNLGSNCEYAAGETMPMECWAADLDGNGSIDPIFCYYVKGDDGKRHSFPAASRKKLAEQIPFIKKRFLLNEDFAKAGFADIYAARPASAKPAIASTSSVAGPDDPSGAPLHLYCVETNSCWLENKGGGRFVRHVLPIRAQFAPVNAILAEDIDKDGHPDLLLAGNEYQTEVMRGRYDASYGCFLRGDGKGNFTASSNSSDGLILSGDIHSLAILPTVKGYRLLLAAPNDDLLQVLKMSNP